MLDDALAALECAEPDDVVLARIEAAVHVLVGDDLVHRLVPFADRLRSFDYRDHPWAGLSCGVAICSVDRPLGRSVLAAAREFFELHGDAVGAGYGSFLEGLQDLGEGNLDGARAWWSRARPELGAVSASRLVSSHLALSAYADGEVGRAVVLGEQALWAAQHAGDDRAEALACLNLALFHLTTGRFAAVDRHVARGLLVSANLGDENGYEVPVLHLAGAALASLRGRGEEAEAGYERALAESRRRGNEWYEAIILAVRAEFTVEADPARSGRDARAAMTYFDRVDEDWWSNAALRALAAVHLAVGDVHAARMACEHVLDREPNPLDRGRTLLLLAEVAVVAADPAATQIALDAVEVLERCGASYWAGRARMLLVRIDRRRAEFHRRLATELAGPDLGDAAWGSVLRGAGRIEIDLRHNGEVRIDGRTIRFQTRAELELVAMLVLAPSGLSPSTIGDRLWPDDDHRKVAHRVDNLVSGLRRRLLPTSRVRRDHRVVVLELVPGESALRDALVEASGVGREPAIGHDARLACIRELTGPILPEARVHWLELERERLAALALRLPPL